MTRATVHCDTRGAGGPGMGGLWHTVATFRALEPCQSDSQRAGEHAEGSGWVRTCLMASYRGSGLGVPTSRNYTMAFKETIQILPFLQIFSTSVVLTTRLIYRSLNWCVIAKITPPRGGGRGYRRRLRRFPPLTDTHTQPPFPCTHARWHALRSADPEIIQCIN